jgi:hypothetical protein
MNFGYGMMAIVDTYFLVQAIVLARKLCDI